MNKRLIERYLTSLIPLLLDSLVSNMATSRFVWLSHLLIRHIEPSARIFELSIFAVLLRLRSILVYVIQYSDTYLEKKKLYQLLKQKSYKILQKEYNLLWIVRYILKFCWHFEYGDEFLIQVKPKKKTLYFSLPRSKNYS